MAAALLQHALAAQPEPLRSIKVISAGVSAVSGEPITENSALALKKVGLGLHDHRSQPLTQHLLDEALLVLCMTESHRSLIELQAEPAPKNLFLFREFLPAPATPEIADPFGGPLALYEATRDEMVEAIPSLVKFIKTQISPRSA